ncbi:hypothetical protein [Pseudomonas extremaustralis]|nr:hypothetical protein [Pseudomonas extremaustralis]
MQRLRPPQRSHAQQLPGDRTHRIHRPVKAERASRGLRAHRLDHDGVA